ncbi:hypothetical protein HOLleu_22472 [Holothuria leucospilota]|uniref:Uncharacterized protein n=1 Tax=Holothuria leucospilota TaxID=206669 RepID=A0A9Q1H6T0_HOLLE|nr:hypothetical protein HOLleu_22472 [Holothuria leucospilota]
MQSKTLYLLLALSVMVAVVTALEDDDELFEMVENYMEKRKGRRGKGKTKTAACPDNPNCWCLFLKDGTVRELTCMPTGNGGRVGI